MSLPYVKPLDTDTIYNHIQETIKNQRLNYQLWKVVESACLKFEGKQITKRIQKVVQDLLPEYKVNYSFEYGMFKIKIYGNGIDYNHEKSFYLGYSTNPIFEIEKIRYSNTCHELEQSRADRLETLTKEDINTHVNTWNEGLVKLQSVNDWAKQYEINYMSYGFDLDIRNP
jgi:hypothetical protein